MKTILITGGSRGIGLAIAEKYLNTQEYNVVVTGRKEQTLEELSKVVANKNFYTIAAKADDEEAAWLGLAHARIEGTTLKDVQLIEE